MDKIRPHVVKFWNAGALPQAMLDRKEVVMTTIWNGRAQTLVDTYGVTDVLEAIDRDPAAAFAAAGLRGARTQESCQAWKELRVTRALHLLLAPHGLAYLVARVHEEYGSSAHHVITERPYELTSLFGVGFALADRIARAGGHPPDAAERARAAVLHLLSEAERAGDERLEQVARRFLR